jgi:4-hydroxy-tetrahydrodipicolinate reductase
MEAQSNLVNRIKVTRIQDASKRRVPFQQKIGAGLTRAQFRAKG